MAERMMFLGRRVGEDLKSRHSPEEPSISVLKISLIQNRL